MNLEVLNDHSSNVVSDGNSNLSYETQTSDYGLDLAENTFSPWLQSDTLSIGNFELEPTQINNSDSHELVFIDSTVRDAQTLIDNISGASEIIVLNDEQDELVQISEHLKDYQQLDAVHIVSHGESGELSFGNATLNSDTLPEYKKTIEEWSLALDEDADLLLYGCEVTLDGKGSSFVQELSLLTQADISASVDDTGISGDWELETSTGEIEATSVFTQKIESAYQHDLADGDFGLVDFPDFNNTDFSNTNFDFNNISPDNLTLFAEAGLDFSTVDPSTLNNIDFNEVPVEDLSILADAGLGLEPLNSEELSEINLDVLKGLDYVEGVEFSAVESVSGETTFAQLSDSVTTNANLFNYKDPTLSFDSGLTLDQLSRFNQSDFEALDYAFTGDEAFDADYYLAQNIDVREDGVNPFTHYVNNGVSEGRDPNATFDTSFYIEQNPDVKDAGVNPFEQYLGYAATDEIVRYPNSTAKSFGTSSGVLVASADLSDSQFINFQDSASLLTDGNDDVAFALPVVIIVGVKVIAFTAASLGIIKAASNIQELVEANEPEIFVPEGDIDPSIPPFDLSEVPRYDPERFPNNNDFLDDILDGRFEFPDAEEGGVGSYFLPIDQQQGTPGGVDLEQASTITSERTTHILDGDPDGTGGHRSGTGRPGKTEFPEGWNDEVVLDNITKVVKDPNSQWTQQTGAAGRQFTRAGDPVIWKVEGTVDNIDIRVIVEPAGQGVVTGFPTNTPPNPLP